MRANATPGVALEIQRQTHDEVEPVRGQVQDVAGLQDDLVGPGLGKLGIDLQIWLAPIHSRVPRTGMVLGIQCHVGALLGMGQYVASLPAHDSNGIAAGKSEKNGTMIDEIVLFHENVISKGANSRAYM